MQLTKLSPSEVANLKLNPHAIKKEWRPGVDMGKLDLFKDRDGRIYIANKDGNPDSADCISS